MAKVDSKLQIQSYIFTTAKYDFSVYEKRILYRQIEIEQKLINQEALDKCIKVDTNLWGDKKYTIPMSMLLGNDDEKDETDEGKSKNNARFKKAFQDLKSKNIEYEDDKQYSCFGVIDKFWIDKYGRNVTWQSDKRIVEAVMDFTKGWRMYELKVAFELKSRYAMRFYEIVANKSKPITYLSSELIKMFGLENKYLQKSGKPNFGIIERRVLKKAQQELDKISPYTFNYKFSKDYATIDITPIHQPQFSNAKYDRKKARQKPNLSHILTEKELSVLIDEFGFTEQGLINNYALFEDCRKTIGVNYSFFMFQEIRNSLQKKGKKVSVGFIIAIIRNQLEQFKKRHT